MTRVSNSVVDWSPTGVSISHTSSEATDVTTAGMNSTDRTDVTTAGMNSTDRTDVTTAGMNSTEPIDVTTAGMNNTDRTDFTTAGMNSTEPTDPTITGLNRQSPYSSIKPLNNTKGVFQTFIFIDMWKKCLIFTAQKITIECV